MGMSHMAIRTILAPVSGCAATEGTVETACRLARRFAAHLEVLHVRADPRESLPLLAPDISASVTDELIAMATQESADSAFNAKTAFDAAVLCHDLPRRNKPLGTGPDAAS